VFYVPVPDTSLENALLTYWGHSSFRPTQRDIITACLSGRDVFVQQSTGFGKSVCFQIPALVSGKTAVVISPLISLMEDQVRALELRGIRACFLGSAQTDSSVPSRAIAGEYQVVYLSPEKTDQWQHGLSALVQKGVCVFAIDEAHCISQVLRNLIMHENTSIKLLNFVFVQWGHDFRDAYTRLSVLRNLFPHIPIMALTATATERVARDIVDSLHLVNPYIAKGSVNRANLYYAVRMKKSIQQDLTAEIVGDQSCIVYCLTKQLAEDAAAVISKFNASVAVYHAGLPLAHRSLVHRQFLTDEVQVVCATVAFGMGIDKPDIRRVIHYGAPKSLEGYMQETGRAGTVLISSHK
jgi:ATP-dependent DNA helicase RecQ